MNYSDLYKLCNTRRIIVDFSQCIEDNPVYVWMPTQRDNRFQLEMKNLIESIKNDAIKQIQTYSEKIDKTIDEITFKQIKQVKLWEKEHPNYLEDDKLLMEWQTMIRNMTTGTNSNMTMDKEKSCIKKELGMTVEVAPEIRQLKLEAANELIDKKI